MYSRRVKELMFFIREGGVVLFATHSCIIERDFRE